MDDESKQQVKSLKGSSGNTRETSKQSLMIHLGELFEIVPTTNAIILRFQNIKMLLVAYVHVCVRRTTQCTYLWLKSQSCIKHTWQCICIPGKKWKIKEFTIIF